MIEMVPDARVGLDIEAIRISVEAGSGLDVFIEPGQMGQIETTFMYRDIALTIRSGLEGGLLAAECSLCLHPQIRRNGARWVRISLEKSGKFREEILDINGRAVQEFEDDLDNYSDGTVVCQEVYPPKNRDGNYAWEVGRRPGGLPFSNGIKLVKEGSKLAIRVNTERGDFLAVKLTGWGLFFESEAWIGLLTTPTEASLREKVLAQLRRMFEVSVGQLEWATLGNEVDGGERREADLSVFERAFE